VLITAHKGNTGHLFAGVGAVETIFSICSILEGMVPKIHNLEDPLDVDLNFVKG